MNVHESGLRGDRSQEILFLAFPAAEYRSGTENLKSAISDSLNIFAEELIARANSSGAGARKRRGIIARECYQALIPLLENGEQIRDFVSFVSRIPPVVRETLRNRMHQGLEFAPRNFSELLFLRTRYLARQHNEGPPLDLRSIWLDSLLNGALRLGFQLTLNSAESFVDRVLRLGLSPSAAWAPDTPNDQKMQMAITGLLPALKLYDTISATGEMPDECRALTSFLESHVSHGDELGATGAPLTRVENHLLRPNAPAPGPAPLPARSSRVNRDEIAAIKKDLRDSLREAAPLPDVLSVITKLSPQVRENLIYSLGGPISLQSLDIPTLFSKHALHLKTEDRLRMIASPLSFAWYSALIHMMASTMTVPALGFEAAFVDSKLRMNPSMPPERVWRSVTEGQRVQPSSLSQCGQFLYIMFTYKKPVDKALSDTKLAANGTSPFTSLLVGLARNLPLRQIEATFANGR